MTANSTPLPPLLFSSQDRAQRAWIAKLKKLGQIRSIGPRLYTSLPPAETSKVVRASWAEIVSTLFPDALLSHRSAIEYRPSPQGELFLTSTTNRELRLPGLTLRFIRGPKALETDDSFMQFRASSLARALLENLSKPRGRGAKVERALPPEELEKKLEAILHAKGETELNRIRDQARKISRAFKWKTEFSRLDAMIGALLGTRPARALVSDAGRARAASSPFDPACFERLELLFGTLRHQPFNELKDSGSTAAHRRNQAFFEAYFSNYIEGTTFEVEEAEAIVFDGKVPALRPKDAHDILGTYAIISDPDDARATPHSAEALDAILKRRHKRLMEFRPEANPGEFKTIPNRAGSTHFVHPDYVSGTLSRGFELYQALPAGLARAAYIMFLANEVHPFTDGNGRIARIMMNAELRAQGLVPIIIPTVYREDYLSALRALSRRNRPMPLVEMLVRAHAFSKLDFTSYPKSLKQLQSQNWFEEPDEAKLITKG